MCHGPDTYPFNDTIAADGLCCATGGGKPCRGVLRNRGRGCGCGFCRGAAWPSGRAGAVDTGSYGTARKWAALSGRAWFAPPAAADAAVASGRCDDRARRGAALHGAGGGHCRNPGRSGCDKLHRDEASCPAGRGDGRALLADPAGRHRRSECGARPLADRHPAFGPASRRSARAGRSALAGRTFPFARCTAGPVGGAP